jgi:hypothetical protein
LIVNQHGLATSGQENIARAFRCFQLSFHGVLFHAVFKISIFDGFVKSKKTPDYVIPEKAVIRLSPAVAEILDLGFRRGDDFLRDHQICSSSKNATVLTLETAFRVLRVNVLACA